MTTLWISIVLVLFVVILYHTSTHGRRGRRSGWIGAGRRPATTDPAGRRESSERSSAFPGSSELPRRDHFSRPCIVGPQSQWQTLIHAHELLQESGAGIQVLSRVEGVFHPKLGGGGGHQLHQAQGALGRDRAGAK